MTSFWLPELIGLPRQEAVVFARAKQQEARGLMSKDIASGFQQVVRWGCQANELEKAVFDTVPRALSVLEYQAACLLQRDGAFVQFDNLKLMAGDYQRAFDEGRLVAYDPPRPFQIEGEL
jgi:hypothetical protein